MKLLFEKSHPGVPKPYLPASGGDGLCDVRDAIPPALLRAQPIGLPELAEPEVVRHYTQLSARNVGIDSNFYPLGSCTMKYNPKVNEFAAGLPGFAELHPAVPEQQVPGAMQLMAELESYLCEIAGMAAFTLGPLAGASGELTGILIIRAYHESQGNPRRTVLVPDSAHGTNPASAAMAGYDVVSVPSTVEGEVDVDAFRELAGPDVAAFMLTNPNTLGVFERRIEDIREIAREHGILLYYDGANLNAIAGKVRPGDMGFDAVHLNLHKTFSTPHGGGGPGAGPVGVSEALIPFLPGPRVHSNQAGDRSWVTAGEHSIGRVGGFYGNFGVLVRAYTYIRAHGADGLCGNSETAVLNANYLRVNLRADYPAAQDRICMHEFVAQPSRALLENGIRTMNVAKRLIDYGIHPPTVYFPLIVKEAMMIEPTETESKATLDHFADVMTEIAADARSNPQRVRDAPHDAVVTRVDEVRAARRGNFSYDPDTIPPDV
ncbi:MAG: aminomethyl-transferring glycine dehydrogenase subunit GcvPB [Verrucomicrobia bacterium]|nr:aminomethyl-transferring glycine dehydrogenase subunit GcvPB [Verrucomicrobiota bacterium]MDA1086397.1 aminomethyl-transferring glycine dehydrogenase subunit GcvPB [Verrucomicrobiota bacterium]